MKKDQELIVITKTYDLILWSCNHTSKFPRNHRFVLGERIERNLYNLLETLIAAKYTKSRQRLLEDDNGKLECSASSSNVVASGSALSPSHRLGSTSSRRTSRSSTASLMPTNGNSRDTSRSSWLRSISRVAAGWN